MYHVVNENHIDSLYSTLEDHNINGLDSIYILLFVLTLQSDLIKHVDFNNSQKYLLKTYNIFNFDISKYKEVIIKLYDYCKVHNLNVKQIINDIFIYYINTENLVIIKDYIKYYNNQLVTKWIINLAKPKVTNNHFEFILDGNVKINSFMKNIIEMAETNKSTELVKKHVFGIQSNHIINDISSLECIFKINDIKDNIVNTDLLITDIKNPDNITSFDLILFDFPVGIHNIIHAACCQKIKKLKLRGTKSEPMLLQLVMMSLNKNGRAVLIVPDSLLFSDSVQPIETRKYLLENFNVKKIIQIDESLYFNNIVDRDLKSIVSGMKNSILYFENTGITENISFSKISLDNGKIQETDMFKINYEQIKNNMYSLYYKHYLTVNKVIDNDIKTIMVKDMIEIIEDGTLDKTKKYLTIPKYHNLDLIKIINGDETPSNICYYLTEKLTHSSQTKDFFLYYLEFIIKNNYEQFTKGKMNQYDINKIKNKELPLLTKDKQTAIINYINITNKLIQFNNDKIKMLKELKECVINTIPTTNLIELSNIVNYSTDPSKKLIGIVKNSLTAGTVYKLETDSIQTNSHYLTVVNDKYHLDYIYHILKFNENKIKELANLTTQPNLNKNKLLLLKIQDINMEKQMEIINHCNYFDDNIKKYELDNNEILNKDIMSIVIKLNGL